MIEVILKPTEMWDEKTNQFIYVNKPVRLQLEHSLLSLSKWEAKYCKPFLKDDKEHPKTKEEIIDYIRCMTISPKNLDIRDYYALTQDQIEEIMKYVNSPQTATTFTEIPGQKNTPNKQSVTMTSELLYYYMTAFNIPFECEKWHLNRLLTLIHICQEKNKQPTKMSKKDAVAQQRALNQMRRAKYHSKG